MRRLLFLLFVLFAAPALAQETYSFSATANQVTTLTQGVIDSNNATCVRLQLAAGCDQASACTAANAAGGASCTAAQARAANARIFPSTQAGREEFIQFVWLQPRFVDMKAALQYTDRQSYCAWFKTQNQATKDAECTKSGRAAGCDMCP